MLFNLFLKCHIWIKSCTFRTYKSYKCAKKSPLITYISWLNYSNILLRDHSKVKSNDRKYLLAFLPQISQTFFSSQLLI